MSGQASPHWPQASGPPSCASGSTALTQVHKRLEVLTGLGERQERVIEKARQLESDLIDWTDEVEQKVQSILDSFPTETQTPAASGTTTTVTTAAASAIDADIESELLPPPLQPQVFAGWSKQIFKKQSARDFIPLSSISMQISFMVRTINEWTLNLIHLFPSNHTDQHIRKNVTASPVFWPRGWTCFIRISLWGVKGNFTHFQTQLSTWETHLVLANNDIILTSSLDLLSNKAISVVFTRFYFTYSSFYQLHCVRHATGYTPLSLLISLKSNSCIFKWDVFVAEVVERARKLSGNPPSLQVCVNSVNSNCVFCSFIFYFQRESRVSLLVCACRQMRLNGNLCYSIDLEQSLCHPVVSGYFNLSIPDVSLHPIAGFTEVLLFFYMVAGLESFGCSWTDYSCNIYSKK